MFQLTILRLEAMVLGAAVSTCHDQNTEFQISRCRDDQNREGERNINLYQTQTDPELRSLENKTLIKKPERFDMRPTP